MINNRYEELEKENITIVEKINKITKGFQGHRETLHSILINYISIKNDMKGYNVPKFLIKKFNSKEKGKLIQENENLKNEYRSWIYLMKRLIQVMKVKNISLEVNKPFFKIDKDKDNIPVCFVSELNKELDGSIKNIRILGVTGDLEEYSKYEDIFIECYIHLINQYSEGICAFITKLDIKQKFRCGRGTMMIKYIEDELLKEVEKIMTNFYKENGYNKEYGYVTKIGGYIGNSGATTVYENKLFYSNLGYTVINRSFTKNYSQIDSV